MALTIYIITLLLNLFLSSVGKKSKVVLVFSSVALFLIMGGNNYNSDYEIYFRFYNLKSYPSSMEFGYVWIAKLFSSIGVEYQVFIQIISAISIVMMLYIASRYIKNLHGFLFLYMSTMLFLDVIQIRQFVAYLFFTIALIMLSKGFKIRFIVFIIIGSLFHITTIVFLPIVFLSVDKVSSRRFIRTFLGIIIVLCIVVFLAGNKIPWLAAIMTKYIDSQKMIYFTTSTHLGFLKYFSFQFVCIYFASIIRDYICDKSDEKMKSFSNTVYIAILYSSFAMPLVMLNNNFYRYFKFGLIGLFICMVYVIDSLRQRKTADGSNLIRIKGNMCGDIVLFRVLLLLFIIAFSILMQSFTNAQEVLSNNIFF